MVIRIFSIIDHIKSLFIFFHPDLFIFSGVRLSALVNPVICFIAFFITCTSTCVLFVLTSIATTFVGYHFALAWMSPEPLFLEHHLFLGQTLVVSNISFICLTCQD